MKVTKPDIKKDKRRKPKRKIGDDSDDQDDADFKPPNVSGPILY